MTDFIQPGAGIGIIGGGPLGYSMAAAAKAMGMNTIILAPSESDIALSLADIPLGGKATDPAALSRLAEVATVVTFANENVDGNALQQLTTKHQLPSGVDILSVTQDRYLEMVFLDDLNVNILPYAQVVGPSDIAKAIESVGLPAILKPIQKDMGADQQLRLTSPDDVVHAQQLLQQRPYILEAWLDHPTEYAVTVVKNGDDIKVMPVVQTVFAHHQLKAAFVPATGGDAVHQEIQRVAKLIAKHLNYTGAFGIELFMTANQSLYVKRLYPAPQLTNHVLASTTGFSPVAMHLRALLGWPLPKLSLLRPGVMIPLRAADAAAAMTQVRIKPDWQFEFYPSGDDLIGTMTIYKPLIEAAQLLNATDHFHLNLTEED